MRDADAATIQLTPGPFDSGQFQTGLGREQYLNPGDARIVEVEDVHGNKVLLSLAALARGVGQPAEASTQLCFDNLRIDTQAREVIVGGVLIELTRREFDLLVFMAEHPRQVFSKAKLLESVWSSDTSWQSEATVTEHVRRLRRKLGYTKSSDHGLTTVWGVGYRFEP